MKEIAIDPISWDKLSSPTRWYVEDAKGLSHFDSHSEADSFAIKQHLAGNTVHGIFSSKRIII